MVIHGWTIWGYQQQSQCQWLAATHPEVGDRQGVPVAVVHHVDQVLAVGGDEGPVEGGQAHGLGLLVAHAVRHVQAHHVTRVRLVERHQVELRIHNVKKKQQTTFIDPNGGEI